MPISFHSLIPSFSLKQKNKLREWLWTTAYLEKKEIERVDFIFCDDKYLLTLNKNFLKHNTLTDIITFPIANNHPGGGINVSGEIYISVPRVKENAKKFSPSFEEEMRRVMAHGVLHLCGYKDKTPKEKSRMRAKENRCLELWSRMINEKSKA